MQKLKHNVHLVVIIAILFVTGLSFASFFRAQGNLLATPVSADDDEDDREEEEEEDDREDDSDNDRDEDEDRDDDEDKDDDEDEDEDEDEQRTYRTRNTTQIRTQEADDDEDENEAEGDDEDENEDSEELTEDIQELNEDMQEVELRINILASNGASVDAFNNNLAEVKGLVAQAQSQLVSNPKGAEDVLETAEHKLERLEKLVKMSLKDDDEDDESVEEATEEISELKRDIAKLENRLNLASARGIDVSVYRTVLDEAKSMLSQAEAKLSAGNYIEAESIAELADKKLERIDDLFEDDDEDEDDDDIAKEYKNEVAMFVHNLKAIGEMEGGIGQQVSVVAQAQNDSQSRVENSIKKVSERNKIVKFLFGPNYGSIKEIKAEIAENRNRIKALTEVMNQITDQGVKLALQNQIQLLEQQNNKLQSLVAKNEKTASVFGWLIRLFS